MLTEDVTLLGQILAAPQAAWASRSCLFCVTSPFPKGWCGGRRCVLHTQWVCMSGLRNTELRESQAFIMGCQQGCLTFVPEKHFIFIILDTKQTCPLLQREMQSLSSKQFAPRNALGKKIQNGSCWPSVWKMCRNGRDPMENCLPAMVYLSIYAALLKLLSAKFGFAE